jgi:protein arginine kinase
MSRGEEIPVSLRIRAARNIPGVPYLRDPEDPRIHTLNQLILGAGSGPVQMFLEFYRSRENDSHRLQWGLADGEDLRTLVEAGILPEHTLAATWFYPDPDRLMIIFGGDEDHIRIQWIFSHIIEERGLENLKSTLEELSYFDSLMQWQYNREFGYLSSCPSNSGAGVRISFMLDLRGLILTRDFLKWKEALKGMGLDVRGDRGEGSSERSRVQISGARFEYGENLEKQARNLLVVIKRLMKTERGVRKLKGIPCNGC